MSSPRVLVTGASTGIGEATARRLAARGFEVLAGVRRAEDAERLRSPGIEPLTLDVTDAQQIEAARELVGGRIDGLVNNAGIAVTAPQEFLPVDELRRQLEVNVVGQVAVTQAMLPALRAARGRVVNVSSVGGRTALPLLGAYNASKWALEALSDSLRRELRHLGVKVSVIEPGGIRTPIWEKGTADAERLREQMSAEGELLYAPLIQAVQAQAERIAREGNPPEGGGPGDRAGAHRAPAEDALRGGRRRARADRPGARAAGQGVRRAGGPCAEGLTHVQACAGPSRERLWE
jgi:NAD(P)-dependent dehydrogenase (short-subunit alcohol dehydrogenase family)